MNADQIEAISRKSEVQSTLKELEDVLQNVRAVEVEHESKLATLRKEILAEEASKEKDSMKHVHRINYALGTPLAELIGKHVIKETEYEALKIAQELIMKPNIAKSYGIIK